MKNLKVVVLLLMVVLFLLVGFFKLCESIIETEKSFGDTYEECTTNYDVAMCNRIYFQ